MDVLITHPYVWPEVRRGAERYLRDLSASLRARGHRVRVLTTSRRGGDRHLDGTEYRGRMLSTWLTRRGVDPLVAFAPTMVWPLLRTRAGIVHALSPGDALAAILTRGRGRPVVTTLMGIPHRWYNERSSSAGRAWRAVLERADGVICLSSHVASVLQAEYGRTGTVIPPGVDTQRFRPVAERTDPPTILFVGALDEPRKRFDLLLQALPAVVAERSDALVVATGHGDPSDAHRARDGLPPHLRDRVEVVDIHSDRLAEAYSSAAVTVLPSRHEAFGLTLAESLACGTPVVGSDECGIVDVVDSPSIGARFAPDDADDLARALVATIDLAQDARTRERCTRSAQRFDWHDVVAPAIEDLYREVVSR